MPQLPRYGVGRVDVATPETPTPSGRNPQAEALMAGGKVLLETALGFKQTLDKRRDLRTDAEANEKFRLLQEAVYTWEGEKEKTADPDAHVAQHTDFFNQSVTKLMSDVKDPMLADKFLKRASGFRTERLKHSFGVQNKAFVDREKSDVVAETEKLGKFEYLMDDATFTKEWESLTQRMDKSLAAGGLSKKDRVLMEQKARDSIWGTRAYRQAVQAVPAENDPEGTAVMWNATKAMEMGQDPRYEGLSPERRLAVTSMLREEYSRRLTTANTKAAEQRRVFNEEVDAMAGEMYSAIERASRGEEFELDGKTAKHSIEDVLQVTNKYSRTLGHRINGIQDNARAYQSIRDRGEKTQPATPEEHNQKAEWLNKALLGEVSNTEIVNSTLRPEFKDEVLRAWFQAKKTPQTPEEKERRDDVRGWARFIKGQLNTQTSAFVRDPRIAGIADRAAIEFSRLAGKDKEADLPELVSQVLKRNSDHLKGALDPGLLHSQLPQRYQDMDENKVVRDIQTNAITRQAGDFYLVQMRWIRSLREKSGGEAQGPEKPAEQSGPGLMDRVKGVFSGKGGAKVRGPQGE